MLHSLAGLVLLACTTISFTSASVLPLFVFDRPPLPPTHHRQCSFLVTQKQILHVKQNYVYVTKTLDNYGDYMAIQAASLQFQREDFHSYTKIDDLHVLAVEGLFDDNDNDNDKDDDEEKRKKSQLVVRATDGKDGLQFEAGGVQWRSGDSEEDNQQQQQQQQWGGEARQRDGESRCKVGEWSQWSGQGGIGSRERSMECRFDCTPPSPSPLLSLPFVRPQEEDCHHPVFMK